MKIDQKRKEKSAELIRELRDFHKKYCDMLFSFEEGKIEEGILLLSLCEETNKLKDKLSKRWVGG